MRARLPKGRIAAVAFRGGASIRNSNERGLSLQSLGSGAAGVSCFSGEAGGRREDLGVGRGAGAGARWFWQPRRCFRGWRWR